MSSEIEVGHVVAGRYRLVRLLGRGAMGEVWLATHQTLDEEVAIKFLRPEGGSGEDQAQTLGRFLFEAKTAARLSKKSRHIVQVTDHGDDGGIPFLVMERLAGDSLEDHFAQGPLHMETLKTIIAQCARGLSVAHAEGVFHRDLKPANVFVGTDDDGKMLVKLLDFGIARAIRPEKKRSPTSTARGVVLGTPSYMSPEQARGLSHLDHRCDVWALAVVAYEGLTGQIPFRGETAEDVYVAVCTHEIVPIEERRRDLGPAVVAFFARALAERLTERFQTAEELSAAFAALELGQAPARMAAETLREAPSEIATHARLAVSMAATPPRRARAAWVAIGTVVALFVVALTVKIVGSSHRGGSSSGASGERESASPPADVLPATTDHASTPPSSPPPSPPIVPDPIPLVAASALPTATHRAAPSQALPAARPGALPPLPAVAPPPPAAVHVAPPPAAPPRPAPTKPDKSEVF